MRPPPNDDFQPTDPGDAAPPLSDAERASLRRARHEQRIADLQARVRQSQLGSGVEPLGAEPSPVAAPVPALAAQAGVEESLSASTAESAAEPVGIALVADAEQIAAHATIAAATHDATHGAAHGERGQALRRVPVWQRPRPSLPVLIFALVVHALFLWLLAQYVPTLPAFSSSPGDGAAGAPAFNFTFRPIATLLLLDESAQRPEGALTEAQAARAKQAVLSTNPVLVVDRNLTTTVPQITADRDPVEGAPVPVVSLRPSVELAAPPPPAPVPEPAPTLAPPAPTASPKVIDGSSMKLTADPAALPRPALAAPGVTTDDTLQSAPTIPALPPPPKPEPVRRNLASAPQQAAPSAVEALRPLASAAQPQAVQPLTLQITLPARAPAPVPAPAATAAPVAQPAATAASVAAPAPATAAAANPSAPSSAVQVIVNVPVGPGQGLPSNLPSSLSVPGSAGGAGGATAAGGAGGVAGSGGGTGTGSGAGGAAGSAGAVGAGSTGAGAGGAAAGSARAAQAGASAARPLNMQLPGGPYAPQRQRSLADLANEQLRRGMATSQMERGVGAAGKQDCVSAQSATASTPQGQVAMGGLLALPGLVWDAATGKCK